MRIRPRLLISFLLIALLPLIAASVITFALGEHFLRDEVLNQLESLVAIQKSRVEDIIGQNLERVALVSSRTGLKNSLQSYLAQGDAASIDSMTASLNDALASSDGFSKIHVLSNDGTVLASTDPAMVGSNEAASDFFKKGMVSDDASVFFAGPGNTLMEYLTGPIELNGRKLGVVAIESKADNLTGLFRDHLGLGRTGEIVLAEKTPDGDAVFISPTRFGKSAVLSQVVPHEKTNVAMSRALQKKKELLTNAVDYRGKPIVAATSYIDNPPMGLVAKIDRSEAFVHIDQLRYLLMIIVVIVAGIVVLASTLIARSITRPIIDLTGVAQDISAGDLSRRAEIRKNDEIGTLAGAFNKMTDDLASERQGLERKVEERTAELARSNIELDGYARTVSHDLRGPLSSIALASSMLAEAVKDSEDEAARLDIEEMVRQIDKSAARSFDMVEGLLALAEAGQVPRRVERVDIADTIQSVLEERAGKIQERGASVIVGDDLGSVMANPTHIYQLFSNLIWNAIKHNDAEKPVVEVLSPGAAEGGGRRYVVRDNGPGISEEDMDRIFEPFFKGKGGETGVGLATVEKIVAQYGGTIAACNEETGGACFEFVLRDFDPGSEVE
jgi:signal transduction histidine kinase